MSLQVVCRRNPDSESLVIGKCASDESLNDRWHDFAIELISRSLGFSALVVIHPLVVDYYGHLCAEHAIPFTRITYRPSPLSREEAMYFIRPTGPDQLKSLASELLDDPIWDTTLTFCRPLPAPVAEDLGHRDWSKAVSLRCSFHDDVMLTWRGSEPELDAVISMLTELARETGIELVTASSSDEVVHLLGWDRRPPRGASAGTEFA